MAELRNINWKSLTKSLLEKDSLEALTKSRSLQWFLTKGFRKQGYLLLDDLDGLILEYKGVRFKPDLINYPRMFEAWDRYRIDRIRPTDIVLDLGANIGSYTIPASQRASEVYSVEPLTPNLLTSNVSLNSPKNCTILGKAIGRTGRMIVDCQEYIGERDSLSFSDMLSLFGRQSYDVIRLDIGGGEWNLIPALVLEGTRVLEIEFHFWDKLKTKYDWSYWKYCLEVSGFGYVARWSKHKHWLYLSAERGWSTRKEVQLVDGSFKGRNLELWKTQ